ncbi:MAG: hypothetical protein ACXVJW_14195 [Acidimicrobiia bacterium]
MKQPCRDTGSVDLVDATPSPDDRSAAITRLVRTRNPSEVERLADELGERAITGGWAGSDRSELVEALLRCLTGEAVRQDADAEDAVCSALEQVGVMIRIDNLVFVFVPDGELAASDAAAVRRYRGWLPSRYTNGR